MAVNGADSTEARRVKGPGKVLGRINVLISAMGSIEREAQRLTIWSPLLLVLGIWSYFSLHEEPGWPLIGILMLGAVVATWQWRAHAWIMAIVILATGFSLARIRTEWVATPLLRGFAADVQVQGRVRDVERRSARRATLVVDIDTASTLPLDEMPRRVRVQLLGKLTLPHIGDHVSGLAILTPVPLPVSPGAFDYGRSLFFQSIGATGRFTNATTISAENIPLEYRLRRAFHGLRGIIGERVRAVIPGALGSFADALITGERAQIPKAMNDSLQSSGLFHILSISGLHMAMVVGSSFWLVRALLALSPALALRRPIKKWAALVGLIVGLFYMLLADSGAATERSFIMVAVMLFAVLVDRPAISLHNLAVAAIIILVMAPEQAVAASFQMSFLAVMGLAAFFEWWNRRPEREVRQEQGVMTRWARRGVLLVLASLATSVIAGTLSGIPAAHHFGRVAPYGVIANALALPVVSIAVMPMALLAALLMPFGLEEIPLWVMEQGLKVVMQISDWVASWPHAGMALPLLSPTVAIALTLAAVFAFTARSGLRLLALPLLVFAAWSWSMEQRPDLFIEEKAKTVAGMNVDGFLVPLPGKGTRFAANHWLKQEGQGETAALAAKRDLWLCSPSLCTATIKSRTVAFLRDTAQIIKPCPEADVIIAQYPLRHSCKGRVATIDRFDVWRNGAYALTFRGGEVQIATSRGHQGNRPWTFKPRPRSKK